jgi:hypothetical protein
MVAEGVVVAQVELTTGVVVATDNVVEVDVELVVVTATTAPPMVNSGRKIGENFRH